MLDPISFKKAKDVDRKYALKTATLEKELNDYKNTLSSVNINQEAKQSVSDYGIVSLPKNCANGQISGVVRGLTATNLVENGDFRDGLTGWSASLSNTPTVSNGVLTFRATSQWGQVNCKNFSIKKDEKMYYKVTVKSDASVYLSYNGSAQFPQHSGSGQWETLSIVRAASADSLNGKTGVIDHRTSDWTDIQIKNAMAINLTQMFGAGNEPTKEQCDKMFANYFEGTKSTVSAVRARSVGKNLFDKNKATTGYRLNQDDGGLYPNINHWYSDYIDVSSFTHIVVNNGDTRADIRICFYDNNKQFLSGNWISSGQFGYRSYEIPSGTKYIRVSELLSRLELFQVERGTQVTPYEPYTESSLYLNAGQPLRSLPNGVKDEIREGQKGYELVKRVGSYTLVEDDIVDIHDAEDTLYAVASSRTLPLENVNEWSVSLIAGTSLENWTEKEGYGYFKDIPEGYLYSYYTRNKNALRLCFPKGTTLEQAKEQLAGTELTYQLAQPEVIPIQSSGTLVGHPSGTVYVEPVVANAGLYTDEGIGVTHTDLPIDYVETVYKIDESGVQHELDPSEAVIATDKLSFTHPSLVRDDIVFFTYFHNLESTIGETTIEYYDSRYTIKDKTTGKFYKWNVVVDNGVASIELVEVL